MPPSSELLTAVKERLNLGRSSDEIIEELEKAGYDEAAIAEVLAASTADAAVAPLPEVTAELPGVFALFGAGWRYLTSHPYLLAILAAPFASIELLAYLSETTDGQLSLVLGAAAGIGSFIALVLYILFLATALYLVAHQSATPSFTTGLRWAKHNWFGLVWIGVLTALVALGGFLLLIVPGIIVAVYMAQSQMVFAVEGKKGIQALLRSRELVQGNWMSLFLRMLGLQLLFFGVMLGVAFGLELAAMTLIDDMVTELVSNVIFTGLSAAGTLMFLVAMRQLYATLSTHKPASPVAITDAATKYKALAWLGGVSLVLIIILAVVGMATLPNVDSDDSLQSPALSLDLGLAQSEAELFFARTGAYAGVCAELSASLETYSIVVCNDSSAAYALSVTEGATTRCIDSTGYRKRIYTDLGEQTSCLSVPLE